MQSNEIHQGRFSGFWAGKGDGNTPFAAETCGLRFRWCGKEMLW